MIVFYVNVEELLLKIVDIECLLVRCFLKGAMWTCNFTIDNRIILFRNDLTRETIVIVVTAVSLKLDRTSVHSL